MSAAEANRTYLTGQLAFGLGAAVTVVDESWWVHGIGLIVVFAGIFVMRRGATALNRSGVLTTRPFTAADWVAAAVVGAMGVGACVLALAAPHGAYGYGLAAAVFALNLGAVVGWAVLFGDRVVAERAAA